MVSADLFVLVLIVLIAVWPIFHVYRVLSDARRWGTSGQGAAWLALSSLFRPARYWWHDRLSLLPADEQQRLLAEEAARLHLTRVDALACPLCGAEIEGAWAVVAGRLAAARRPAQCPRCDFRLDACRHCAHLQPEREGIGGEDFTRGRCRFYKRPQRVEDFCAPQIAAQLRARGWDVMNGPAPIADSYIPLDGCRAFTLEEKRLRFSGVRQPGPRQRGLLRLLDDGRRVAHHEELAPAGDEQWLL